MRPIGELKIKKCVAQTISPFLDASTFLEIIFVGKVKLTYIYGIYAKRPTEFGATHRHC